MSTEDNLTLNTFTFILNPRPFWLFPGLLDKILPKVTISLYHIKSDVIVLYPTEYMFPDSTQQKDDKLTMNTRKVSCFKM